MPPDTQHHICIQKSSIQPTLLHEAAAVAMIWKMLERVGRSGRSRGMVRASTRSPLWGHCLGVLGPVEKLAS